MPNRDDAAKTYDAVVDEYVAHIYAELADKPLDRELLDRFAEAVREYLREAGFAIDGVRERDPYPDVEHPSRRSYIVARTPDGQEPTHHL